MPDRAPGKTWAALAGLAIVAIAMRAWFLAGPQIDYDEGVYWQSLRALAAGHPLFSSVYSSQPPGFLLLLTPFYDMFGHSLPGARAGVAFFSLLGVGAAYVAMSQVAGRGSGIAAVAILIADPLYLRQSVTLQADGPALAIALCAVAIAAVGREEEDRWRIFTAAAAGAVLGVACMVKLLALPAALPLLLLLMPSRARLAAAAGGGLGAIALLLVPFAGELGLVAQQSIGLHLGGTAGSLTNIGGLCTLARWELPLALAGALAAAFHRPRSALLMAGGWLGLAVFALAFIHPLWPHHLVAVSVPLALLAAPLMASIPAPRFVAGGAATLAAAFACVAIVLSQQQPPAGAAIERIAQLTRPNQEVITDDQFGAALADRSTPPELVDTSFVRIRSGDLTLADVEGIARRDRVPVLVLATGRLAQLTGLDHWASSAYPKRETVSGQSFLVAP